MPGEKTPELILPTSTHNMSSFQIPKNGFYMFWFMAVHHVDPHLQLFDSSKELNTTCQMVFDWLMFELNFNMVVMYKYATLVEDILVFVFSQAAET